MTLNHLKSTLLLISRFEHQQRFILYIITTFNAPKLEIEVRKKFDKYFA